MKVTFRERRLQKPKEAMSLFLCRAERVALQQQDSGAGKGGKW
jgi:hypothetical protein